MNKIKKSFERKKPLVVVLAAGIAITLGKIGLSAMGHRLPPVQYSTWIVYWDKDAGKTMSQQYENAFEQVDVFAAHFDPAKNLTPADPWVTEALTRPYFLTAVNDVVSAGKTQQKDPAIIDAILSTPESRAKHIDDLLAMSASAGGVEIDYERVLAKDRDLFSQFIKELATRLHERGQQLSVVVEPKTKDDVKDGAGAIDWAAISQSADMIKIMAYYYHYGGSGPGAIAPPDWVATLARFALTEIPRERLCIALTLQGYDWPAGAEGKPVRYADAAQLAQAHHADINRDDETLSPTFTYEDQGVKHEVWFEDAVSITKKIETLQQEGVSHIAFWFLGTGTPEIWGQLPPRSKDSKKKK